MGIFSWLFKWQESKAARTRQHFGQEWPVLPVSDAKKIATFWSNVLGFRVETVTAEQTNLSYEDGIQKVNGVQVPKQKFLLVFGSSTTPRPANILVLPTSWFESELGAGYLDFYKDSELQRVFETKVKENQGRVWVFQECLPGGSTIRRAEGFPFSARSQINQRQRMPGGEQSENESKVDGNSTSFFPF